ncbi:hypothetical protein PYW07_009784 [Mythimna separata]|uniref:Lipase domain-containing protein n=1 Tax=Mythimna separata TaxID=271217 RepID=A0AAD8DMK4_MYTSE|nr:hypothetical protein PYW07_009784 [Mythimna separata]
MSVQDGNTENYNFFEEAVEYVPNQMSRLISFLSALWLSTAAAHPGFPDFPDFVTSAKNKAQNEVQAITDPFGKGVAFIGGSLCSTVKPIVGVGYGNYVEEPDMSKLTLVYITSGKTVIYNLTQAAVEMPKEEWFDPQCRMLVYMHGFTDNPEKTSFQTIRLAAEEGLGDCVSILALDASSLIKFFYLRASTIVTFIGRSLGATLAALVSSGLEPPKIHLIGHSLGSHISGSAGKEFLKRTGHKVGRISGLDPAGPCFSDVAPALRLTRNDAAFVDVIHTDAGVYGLDQKIGHVDFWPNSGSEQPGCLLQTCSHSRAWEYFAESMSTRHAFLSIQCPSYYTFRQSNCTTSDIIVMGYDTPANASGDYYLITAGQSPYGLGPLGTTYEGTSFIREAGFNVKDHLFQG